MLILPSPGTCQQEPVPWAVLQTTTAGVPGVGEVFNARDNGVTCDGTADDQPALDALARKAGQASAGRPLPALIYLPPSQRPCMLSKAFVVPGNVVLFATPGTVTLKPLANTSADNLLLNIKFVRDVLVYGVAFDGGAPIDNAARLALVYASNNVVFDRVSFRHSRGIALEWAGETAQSSVRDSEFDDIGNYWEVSGKRADRLAAINWDCGQLHSSIAVERNRITNAGLDSISICDAEHVTIKGNVIVVTTNQYARLKSADYPAGIYLVRAKDGTIIGNSITGAAGACIDIARVQDMVVTDNRGRDCGASGAAVASAINVAVSCNVFTNNARTTRNGLSVPPHRGGITIVGPASQVVINANELVDTQRPPTQQWGVQAVAGTGPIDGIAIDASNRIEGNLYGNVTPSLQAFVASAKREQQPGCKIPPE
jgi:hypothetical protein